MSESFLIYARWTAKYGINIVPGFRGERFSGLKTGQRLATTNDMQLQEWAENEDYVNPIAVSKTGETIFVDIDDPNMVSKLPPSLRPWLWIRRAVVYTPTQLDSGSRGAG